MPEPRLSYEASCQRLIPTYLESIPPNPIRQPRFDDEGSLGVSFFRTFIGEGEDLSNLTLPRTFFGKSELNSVSFRNTDLSESNFCWNDFVNVDFSSSTLTDSDMRASVFENVSFADADLSGSDLRHSSFEGCDFVGATMSGTLLARSQRKALYLSKEQHRKVRWCWTNGPEPGGG